MNALGSYKKIAGVKNGGAVRLQETDIFCVCQFKKKMSANSSFPPPNTGLFGNIPAMSHHQH